MARTYTKIKNTETAKEFKHKLNFIIILLLLITLGVSLGGGFFWLQYWRINSSIVIQSGNSIEQTETVLQEVNNLNINASFQKNLLYPEETKPSIIEQNNDESSEVAKIVPPNKIDPCKDKPVETMECKLEYVGALNESITNQSKIILVDVSNQRMHAIENGNIFVDTLVTTGKDGYETPSGIRTVQNKARNVNLRANAYFRARGENYSVWSDYWIGLGDGYGIHDAYRWRSVYGGQDYRTRGSHGCINTPLAEVKKIYNWVDIGTKVIIFR